MNTFQRIKLAKKSLKGISIGDAFGESFFGDTEEMLQHIDQRTIPDTKWEFTDDTIMAIAVYEQMVEHQTIHQNQLAEVFSICAIVGGITIMCSDDEKIPEKWIESVEDFETSIFSKKES